MIHDSVQSYKQPHNVTIFWHRETKQFPDMMKQPRTQTPQSRALSQTKALRC